MSFLKPCILLGLTLSLPGQALTPSSRLHLVFESRSEAFKNELESGLRQNFPELTLTSGSAQESPADPLDFVFVLLKDEEVRTQYLRRLRQATESPLELHEHSVVIAPSLFNVFDPYDRVVFAQDDLEAQSSGTILAPRNARAAQIPLEATFFYLIELEEQKRNGTSSGELGDYAALLLQKATDFRKSLSSL
jgi:hypothetical protein